MTGNGDGLDLISMDGIFLGLPFWITAGYLFRPSAFRQTEWRSQQGLLTRLFVVCLAAGLTFQSEPLARRVEAAAVNNLTWLLGYGLTVAGVYAGYAAWGTLRDISTRHAAIVSFVADGILVLLFPALALSPTHSHNEMPDTTVALAYHIVIYFYLAYMAVAVLREVKTLQRNEELPTGRIRLTIGSIALWFGLLFAAARLIVSPILYTDPAVGWARGAYSFSGLFLLLCAVGFALTLAPLHWLHPLARAYLYVEQQRTLRDLESLRRELVRLSRPLPWPLPAWKERLRQPSYALYCVLIDLLDRRSLLLETAAMDCVRIPTGLAWILQPFPDTGDWIEMLNYVRGRVPRRSFREQLARALSWIFFPLTWPLPTLWLAMWLTTGDPSIASLWTGLFAFAISAPLVVFLFVRVRLGHYSDADVSRREQRFGIFMLGLAVLAGGTIASAHFGAPRIFVASLSAAFVALGIGTWVTRRTKASVHAGVCAGCAVVLTFASPAVGLGAALACLAVSWARVYLRQHTPRQIVLGWLIAVGSTLLVFALIHI